MLLNHLCFFDLYSKTKFCSAFENIHSLLPAPNAADLAFENADAPAFAAEPNTPPTADLAEEAAFAPA